MLPRRKERNGKGREEVYIVQIINVMVNGDNNGRLDVEEIWLKRADNKMDDKITD